MSLNAIQRRGIWARAVGLASVFTLLSLGGLTVTAQLIGKEAAERYLSAQPQDTIALGEDRSLKPDPIVEGNAVTESHSPSPAMEVTALQPEGALSIAPDPALIETDAAGRTLPRIGRDGRMPWQVYARPLTTEATGPILAIVLHDVGINRALMAQSLELLPPEITFALPSALPDLTMQTKLVRDAGHETLLQLPLSRDYPTSDLGALTLDNMSADKTTLQKLLLDNIAKEQSTIGIFSTLMPSPTLSAIISKIQDNRGLLSIAPSPLPQGDSMTPRLGINEIVSWDADTEHLGLMLERAELRAKHMGSATLSLPITSQTLSALPKWLSALDIQGITVVPLSAMGSIPKNMHMGE